MEFQAVLGVFLKVGRQIKEGKRKWPIEAMVMVGVSVGCLKNCLWAHPPKGGTQPCKEILWRSVRFWGARNDYARADAKAKQAASSSTSIE